MGASVDLYTHHSACRDIYNKQSTDIDNILNILYVLMKEQNKTHCYKCENMNRINKQIARKKDSQATLFHLEKGRTTDVVSYLQEFMTTN